MTLLRVWAEPIINSSEIPIKRSIRFADTIYEWAPLSQVPKPPSSYYAKGVPCSAEHGLGSRPKNPRAFEKARPKLSLCCATQTKPLPFTKTGAASSYPHIKWGLGSMTPAGFGAEPHYQSIGDTSIGDTSIAGAQAPELLLR